VRSEPVRLSPRQSFSQCQFLSRFRSVSLHIQLEQSVYVLTEGIASFLIAAEHVE